MVKVSFDFTRLQFSEMNIRRPLPRLLREDVPNPMFEDLIGLALTRMLHIVVPNSKNPPPRLFPLAESIRWEFFTLEDWNNFGDLETEHGRLTYTHPTYPERGAPSTSEDTLRSLLNQTSVLAEWPGVISTLKKHAMAALDFVYKIQCKGTSGRELATKADYLTMSVDYDASKSSSEISLHLWKRSLREIAGHLAKGIYMGVLEFL